MRPALLFIDLDDDDCGWTTYISLVNIFPSTSKQQTRQQQQQL